MAMTLLFDTWGTLVRQLFDRRRDRAVRWQVAHRAKDCPGLADASKWAMFYTTLANSFVPHPGLNEACLRWALDKHHVELSEAAIKDINDNYHKLRAYPDVVGALEFAQGARAYLEDSCQPDKKMIEEHSKFAGTFPYLDEIISSGEEAQAFKPSPKVYELGVRRAGCPKEQILWVTGHFWEIVGAVRQGLKCAWTNRARQPILKIGVTPTYAVQNLQELADRLKREGR